MPPLSSTDSALPLSALFHQAVGLYQKNQLSQSEALLQQILQLAPLHAAALHLLGVIAHQGGNTEAAMQLLRQAVELAPEQAQFASNLCEMCRRAGQLEEAIAYGRRATASAPGLASAHSNLGIAYYDQGELEQARACQERALAIEPKLVPALNNLGSIARDCGDRAGAIAYYRRALDIAPYYGESINNLGSVLTENEEPEEALKLLLPLVRDDPDYAEAHCNIGTAFLVLDDLDKAAIGFRRTLELKPREDKAFIGLARVLQEQRQLDAAQKAAEQALALAPHKAEVHSLLGSLYGEAGYMEKAEQAYRTAQELRPQLLSIYLGRGHLRMENGDMTGAESDFRHALSLDANNLGARLAIAQVARVKQGDANMAALIALAQRQEMLSENKAMSLHFGLGKCYEDTKQYDLAFRHYQEGCRLKRKRIEYSADNTDLIGRNIREFFTRENIARLRGAGCQSDLPIFVLGMPRSGTTLTETILASHPDVFGAGELHDIIQIAAHARVEGIGYPRNMCGIEQADLSAMGAQYVAGLRSRAPGSPRITDKMPANFHYLGLIHLMLPNAKIVHVKRNPVDTCLSNYTRLFNRSQYQSYDLTEVGRYYLHYARLMEHWRMVLPADAFYEIQYEELVADQEGQARALLKYCGLEWNDACMDFYKTERVVRTASITQVRQPIYTSSVEKWRKYQNHLEPLLQVLSDLT